MSALVGVGALNRGDAIGLIGVLLALLFGTLALRSSQDQQDQILAVLSSSASHAQALEGIRERLEQEMTHAVRRVTDALQTVYIGSAPHFLPEITALLSRATSSVAILCDHPTTLLVSNGRAFDEYFQVLRQKVAACSAYPPAMKAELVFLADDEQRELDETQFGLHAQSAEDWRAWVDARVDWTDTHGSDVPPTGLLPDFWERTASLCGLDSRFPSKLEFQEFIERIAETDRIVRERYLTGADIYDLQVRDAEGRPVARRNGPAVYLWMRDAAVPDEAEAIFVLVPQGTKPGQSREEAFSTRDPNLIQALQGLFERYRLAAETPSTIAE